MAKVLLVFHFFGYEKGKIKEYGSRLVCLQELRILLFHLGMNRIHVSGAHIVWWAYKSYIKQIKCV